MSVSLDGCKTIHDMNRCNSYDTIIAGVPFWKKIKHNIGIKMTITHNSLPFLYESIKSIIDLNAKSILLTFVKKNVWQANDGRIVYNQLKLIADYIIDNNLWISKNTDINFFDYRLILNSDEEYLPNCCSGERCCELAIDCDGNVFNCFKFAICDNYLEQTIGNIYNDINYKKLLPFYFCNTIHKNTLPLKCKGCNAKKYCVSCAAINYIENGSIYITKQYICNIYINVDIANRYYLEKNI